MSTAIKQKLDNFKSIQWGEVFAIVAILVSIGAWVLPRIDRQFDGIDRQFDKIEKTLQRIERDNRDFHGRLSHLEGKLEKKEN